MFWFLFTFSSLLFTSSFLCLYTILYLYITHSLPPSLTHSPTHSLTHSPYLPFSDFSSSLFLSLTHSLTHSLTYSLTHSLTISSLHRFLQLSHWDPLTKTVDIIRTIQEVSSYIIIRTSLYYILFHLTYFIYASNLLTTRCIIKKVSDFYDLKIFLLFFDICLIIRFVFYFL